MLEGKFQGWNQTIKVINCYGPYKHREEFWLQILEDGFIFDPFVILGGYFNFTMSNREIWGPRARPDPMASLFKHILDSNHLVDVEPLQFLPTCTNGSVGDMFIAKRLDRFWASKSLLTKSRKYKSWIESDHSPIVLQVDFEREQWNCSFKFNHN